MSQITVLTTTQIKQKLNRIAFQILENNFSEKEIILVGIEGNGFTVAKRLEELLKSISKFKVTLGKITINKQNPLTEKPVLSLKESEFKGKVVVLVDDVLNSGRTLIYGVREFLDKPIKKLNTVVLVDRSHTNFPVKADFVGLSLSTTLQEHIVADLSKKGKEVVYIT